MTIDNLSEMEICEHTFRHIMIFVADMDADGKPQFDRLMQCTKCKTLDTAPLEW